MDHHTIPRKERHSSKKIGIPNPYDRCDRAKQVSLVPVHFGIGMLFGTVMQHIAQTYFGIWLLCNEEEKVPLI